MKPFSRADRISAKIKESLINVFNKKISDSIFDMVTITNVKLSKDLRVADIFYTIFNTNTKSLDFQKEALEKAFGKAKGFIRTSIAKDLNLKYMPDIRFFWDSSFEKGEEVHSLLKSLQTND